MNSEVGGSIASIGGALRKGKLTSVELVESVLAQAEDHDATVGAFVSRFPESARTAARIADRELTEGRNRGPLHGIPIAVKDLLATDDGETTGQSHGWDREWGRRGDGPAMRRLREAGAIVVGKTTTMELATGLPTVEDGFPVPRNPWDTERWPGGSSSGSGIAVATGMAVAAIGTDTGGSIRCPASLSGVTGFKPSFGLVPKSGVLPVGLTYDHVGPLARSAEDCAILTSVMAGFDVTDPLSARGEHPPADSMIGRTLQGVRVGMLRSIYEGVEGVDATLIGRMDEAAEVLREAGAMVVDVSIPLWRELGDATMLGAVCEHYANFAEELAERWDSIGRSARTTLALGALTSARDYAQAQRVRAWGAHQMRDVWARVDLIASPTTPRSAMFLTDMSSIGIFPSFTSPWNGLGVPAVSFPIRPDIDGLPQGMQLAGPLFSDAVVLAAAHAFQRLTSWHRALPDPLVTSSRRGAH